MSAKTQVLERLGEIANGPFIYCNKSGGKLVRTAETTPGVFRCCGCGSRAHVVLDVVVDG